MVIFNSLFLWALVDYVIDRWNFLPGMFPNHIPNPEDKVAMKAITQAVIDNKADLGIIFDTDVDRWWISVFRKLMWFWLIFSFAYCHLLGFRSAAVDSSGRELNRNRLIALMSAIVLEEVNS